VWLKRKLLGPPAVNQRVTQRENKPGPQPLPVVSDPGLAK